MLANGLLGRRRPAWTHGMFIYLVSFAVLTTLVFATPGFLGTDDYYHARIATQIIEQRHLALDFPWLPKTILSPERFVDHHLLYHLYIAPWTYLAGIAGAKAATVTIAAAIFVAVWVLLKRIGTHWPVLWTLALFGLSTPFLYRMLMIRTQGASLLLLIVALHLMFQRRYRWLATLAFAYTWLYDGFILLLGFAVLYVAGQWIAERRFDWRPAAYCAMGTTLGLVINPYFPRNIVFILEHLGAKVDFESGVRIGNEWYPYTTGVLLSNSAGALLALAAGFLRPTFNGRQRDRVENTLLFVALLTLFMVFRSRRFIEYFPAFALLFCAASWRRESLSPVLPRFPSIFARGGTIVTLLMLATTTVSDTYRSVQNATTIDRFAGASSWLQAHTPPGTLVFQTDWDDFTRLFYYNTANTYLVGLDPTYLERADPVLWGQWVSITNGEVEHPSAIIQSVFGASYVVSDRGHEAFENQASADPNMKLVYQDEYSYIWHITPTATVDTSG